MKSIMLDNVLYVLEVNTGQVVWSLVSYHHLYFHSFLVNHLYRHPLFLDLSLNEISLIIIMMVMSKIIIFCTNTFLLTPLCLVFRHSVFILHFLVLFVACVFSCLSFCFSCFLNFLFSSCICSHFFFLPSYLFLLFPLASALFLHFCFNNITYSLFLSVSTVCLFLWLSLAFSRSIAILSVYSLVLSADVPYIKSSSDGQLGLLASSHSPIHICSC